MLRGQGQHYSAIDGEPGFMTFISQAAPNSAAPTRDDVVAAMEELVNEPVVPGTVERSREAVLIDVPATQGKQIAAVSHSHTPRQTLSPGVVMSNKARWVRLSPLAQRELARLP